MKLNSTTSWGQASSTIGILSFRGLLAVLTMCAALGLLLAQADWFEGTQAGDQREISKVRFRWAPPGTFQMGSPLGEAERRPDEGPVRVTISRGFWVGQYEVTQGQWARLMGAFPRKLDRGLGTSFPYIG
jgi:formylglycine-generating enzyme required for sulfatase activity